MPDHDGDRSLRDKLSRVEATVNDLRDQKAKTASTLATLDEAFEQAKKAYADAAAGDDAEARKNAGEARKSRDEAYTKLDRINADLGDATDEQVDLLKMLGKSPEAEDRTKGFRGGSEDEQPKDRAWSSKSLFGGDVAERLASKSGSKSHVGQVNLGQVADRDALKADITGTTNLRRGVTQGPILPLRRRLRLLDLIATGTTNGNSVPYVQETGSYNAAETAESATKPEGGLVLTDVEAPVRTIAEWQKMPKQALADVPALRSVIDDRLRYGVLRRLEGQIIAGSGTAPNLGGILNTSGIGSVTFAAGTPLSDLILKGLVQVMSADGEPNAIVINPIDWGNVMTAKTSGSGAYLNGTDHGGPLGENGPNLWGVPLVPSNAIASGTALVGDFQMGAQVFIREGVNVLLSDADGNDFTQNRFTILAEMRAALAIWRPTAFSKVALA